MKQEAQNKLEEKFVLKVVMVGDSGTGKTCILNQYKSGTFISTFQPTVAVDFKTKTVEVDERKVEINVWDTAGQERFKTLTSSYYKLAQSIILVYDVTERQTFDNLEFWMSQIQDHAEKDISLMLLANKSDLEEKQVSYEQGLRFAEQLGLLFKEVSAKNSSDISEAFELLARQELKRAGKNPPTNKTMKLNSSSPPQQKQKTQSRQGWSCC